MTERDERCPPRGVWLVIAPRPGRAEMLPLFAPGLLVRAGADGLAARWLAAFRAAISAGPAP